MNFSHVGLVVRDIKKVVKVYKDIGFTQMAPPVERVWDSRQYEVYGQPLSPATAVKTMESHLRRGAFNLLFIQPVAGEGPYREFLDKHGEGISYICFAAADLAREQAKLVKSGFPVIQRVSAPDGSLLETYHDTRKIGNVIMALWQAPSHLLDYAPGDRSAKNWRFGRYDHIAFVVKDIDKAAAYFETMGTEVISTDEAVWGGDFMRYNDKPLPPTQLKLYILQRGAVTIELFQAQEGANPWSDFLKKHGEGVHHIHFSVTNLDRERDKMARKGLPVTFSITWENRLVEAFFEPPGSVSIGLFRTTGTPVRFKGLPE